MRRILDRVYREDWRSLGYRTPVTTEQRKALRSYTWACDQYLNQGAQGACVGFGFIHEAAARPKVHQVNESFAFGLYHEAQRIDEWEGEAYEGTSVLAGAKAYKTRGYCGEYRWCLTMEDLIATIGYLGPVVIGVDWYEGMFDADPQGFVHVSGEWGGGHCVLVRGVKVVFKDRLLPKTIDNLDFDKSSFLIHNSWGTYWGQNGTCRISVADMQILMDDQGDFCIISQRL